METGRSLLLDAIVGILLDNHVLHRQDEYFRQSIDLLQIHTLGNACQNCLNHLLACLPHGPLGFNGEGRDVF